MTRQETQCRQVVEYLREHQTMTQRDADRLGIKRLASRVCDLNKAGHHVRSELIKVTNSDGTTSRVAQYSLGKEEECIQQKKRNEDIRVSSNRNQSRCVTESPATDVRSGSERCGHMKTETTSTAMTFEKISELVTKINSASQKQRDEAVLYVNFFDYLEMKEKCVRSLFQDDKFCGVELKTKMECPRGKYYIIRRK